MESLFYLSRPHAVCYGVKFTTMANDEIVSMTTTRNSDTAKPYPSEEAETLRARRANSKILKMWENFDGSFSAAVFVFT